METFSIETVTMCLNDQNNVHNEPHIFCSFITSTADASYFISTIGTAEYSNSADYYTVT